MPWLSHCTGLSAHGAHDILVVPAWQWLPRRVQPQAATRLLAGRPGDGEKKRRRGEPRLTLRGGVFMVF